jgi:hypothetical protein
MPDISKRSKVTPPGSQVGAHREGDRQLAARHHGRPATHPASCPRGFQAGPGALLAQRALKLGQCREQMDLQPARRGRRLDRLDQRSPRVELSGDAGFGVGQQRHGDQGDDRAQDLRKRRLAARSQTTTISSSAADSVTRLATPGCSEPSQMPPTRRSCVASHRTPAATLSRAS